MIMLNKQKISILILIGLLLTMSMLACRVSVPPQQAITIPEVTIVVPTMIAPELPEITIPEITIPQILQDEQDVIVSLYERINPAVVNITVYSSLNGNLTPLGQGSGFLYDQNGNFITNAHVVHGADEIEVNFSDGTIEPAKLVGEDLNSDLAVVRVDKVPTESQPLPLGNLEDVKVGQTVVAIGNPFGFEGTLTRGIVSAIGRSIPALTPFSIPEAIQTDAPINPGNSGGPLLNLAGQVIGVNAQIETDGLSNTNSGVGFAIPVSIVKRVVPELIANGKFSWGWLGVRGTSLTPILAEAMNLPVNKGAYITEVLANGPAEKAGLRGSSRNQSFKGRQVPVGGDVITAVDGSPIQSFDDLLIFVALNTSPGQTVNLTVLRDGKTQEIPLTLEPRPASLQESTPQNP